MDRTSVRLPLSVVLPAAVVAGLALYPVLGARPCGPWAWLAPLPLLWLAFALARTSHAWMAVGLACLIGNAALFPYLKLVMPTAVALWLVLLQALLWSAVTMASRRIMQRHTRAWTVLAWPLLMVAVDTAKAMWLADGNWGSLAYSQADWLPILQLASIGGVPLLLLVLSLLPSALAWGLWRWRGGLAPARAALPAIASALLIAVLAAAGQWRITHLPPASTTLAVGLASIDDPIGAQAVEAHWRPIRDRYDVLIAELAAQGAELVVLPEALAVCSEPELSKWQAHFARQAQQHRIWLALGITEHRGQPRNLQWLFNPAGRLDASYQKHLLAPPERIKGYAAGSAVVQTTLQGLPVGLAICKDMHFARFGRHYGQRQAALMLVPAWDFAYIDDWMGERITAVRGVENGYAVVRVAREGRLGVSDASGALLAHRASASMPGSSLRVDVPVATGITPFYARAGQAIDWLALLLGASLWVSSWWPRRRMGG